MAVQYGIHDYKEFKPTLTNPQLELGTFAPITLAYTPMNFDIYQKAIDAMNEADEKLREKETAIDNAFAEQRKLVHGDAKTLKMFDDKVAEYKDKVKQSVDANMGSYHRMNDTIQHYAKDFANDKLIPQLTKVGTEVNKWIDTVKSNNNLSDIRKKRLISTVDNDKDFDNFLTKDDNGNVIGGTSWIPKVEIINDISDVEMEATLKSFVAASSSEKRHSNAAYNESTREGEKNEALYKVTHTSGTRIESITDKDWDQAADDLFNLYGYDKVLSERIKDMEFEYNKLNKELSRTDLDTSTAKYIENKTRRDKLKEQLYPNGGSVAVTAKQDMIQKLKNFAHNGSFTKSVSIAENDIDRTGLGNGGIKGNPLTGEDQSILLDENKVHGAPVGKAPDLYGGGGLMPSKPIIFGDKYEYKDGKVVKRQ